MSMRAGNKGISTLNWLKICNNTSLVFDFEIFVFFLSKNSKILIDFLSIYKSNKSYNNI